MVRAARALMSGFYPTFRRRLSLAQWESTSTISMAWHFTTKSGGICQFLEGNFKRLNMDSGELREQELQQSSQ